MKLIKQDELIIKKSKFIGYYYDLDNVEEVKDILNILKKEHKKAKHIVYAYKFDNTAKKCDDKEPANTAGTPIYNILEKKNLNRKLIIVVRYFGGIKLGAGGLIRAYSGIANIVSN